GFSAGVSPSGEKRLDTGSGWWGTVGLCLGLRFLRTVTQPMANKYERDFMEQAGDLSPYVAVTRNKAGFNKVMDDMFRDEINWGTVVGLFVVGGATYVQSFQGSASEPVCHVADWMTDYLDQRINPWIESQGGWNCAIYIGMQTWCV
uniref:Bcl-2 Bcl-2 homology region 1-3 domain-containing protein n=1 Tax=Takifugu rubripes TaxID=31033 RepID=A0A674PB42_TAKRU